MDLAGDVAEAALAAFEPLLRPRCVLTRRAHGFERRALRAVGFGKRVFALRQRIGGVAPRRLRGFNLADQGPALLLEHARGVREACAFALGLFDARLQRLELRRRAVVALAPGLAVGGECREAPSGNLRLARERLRLGADLGEP